MQISFHQILNLKFEDGLCNHVGMYNHWNAESGFIGMCEYFSV